MIIVNQNRKELTISNPSFARLAACSPDVQYIALIKKKKDRDIRAPYYSSLNEERKKLTTSSGIHERLLIFFVSLLPLRDADQGMVLDNQVKWIEDRKSVV